MMHKLLRWLAVMLCLCLCTGASAEMELIPQLGRWDADLPLEISLSADVKVHMPFDDNRCGQLNALLKHISLKLATDHTDSAQLSRVSVLVDGKEAMWMLQREENEATQLQVSWQPEITYAGQDAMNSLMGSEAVEMSLYGMKGGEEAWLNDGAMLMDSIGASLEDYKKQSSIKTTIKNMGTARTKVIYTVPKGKTELFTAAIDAHCPEGALRDFLMGLSFSGQQKLILWLNADGRVLRAEYSGKCGADADALRQVSLKWRMLRSESAVRDDLTLKSPAVKGGDYNTLTCVRNLTKSEEGIVKLDGEFKYTVKSGKEKTTLSGETNLASRPEGEGNQLEGSVLVSRKLPGADYASGTKLIPALLISDDGGALVVSGTLGVQEYYGDNLVEDAVVSISAAAGNALEWHGNGLGIDVTSMSNQQRESAAEGLAAALIPHLVLLPQEDTLYLSADLPEDVWQRIVEAAKTMLPEEVTQ